MCTEKDKQRQAVNGAEENIDNDMKLLQDNDIKDVAGGYKPIYHKCLTCGADFVGKQADGEAFVNYHKSLYHIVN